MYTVDHYLKLSNVEMQPDTRPTAGLCSYSSARLLVQASMEDERVDKGKIARII